MKKLICLCLLSLISCNQQIDKKITPKNNNKIPPPPEKPCGDIKVNSIITAGYSYSDIDTVIFKTYLKGSNFSTFQNEYIIYPRDFVYDKIREHRSVEIPDSVTTAFDVKIILSNKKEFKLTEMKSFWIPRFCHSFCGYGKEMNYKLDGVFGGGNVFLWKAL